MIRDVPSLSTYPWRASIQSSSLEKFSLNQTNEIKNQTKPHKTSYEFTCSNSKGCVHKKNNNYVALCIYKPYRGESESQGKISVHYNETKYSSKVISDSPTLTC